jgi:hypothetical protein
MKAQQAFALYTEARASKIKEELDWCRQRGYHDNREAREKEPEAYLNFIKNEWGARFPCGDKPYEWFATSYEIIYASLRTNQSYLTVLRDHYQKESPDGRWVEFDRVHLRSHMEWVEPARIVVNDMDLSDLYISLFLKTQKAIRILWDATINLRLGSPEWLSAIDALHDELGLPEDATWPFRKP